MLTCTVSTYVDSITVTIDSLVEHIIYGQKSKTGSHSFTIMSSDSDPLLKHPRFKYHWLLKFKMLKHLCLSSKAAILIILWATMIGVANTLFQDVVAVSILGKFLCTHDGYSHLRLGTTHYTDIYYDPLYPLSGFIAVVFYRRFKMVILSLTLMLISFLFLVFETSLVHCLE